MHKLLFSLLLMSTLSFAGIINGLALTINDSPVTLHDIDKMMTENKIDRNQAISLLIDKAIYEELVKKYSINVDIFDVNDYIDKLAKSNKMDTYTFKSLLKQKYKNYTKFEDNIKAEIIKQKLLQKVVKGQLKIADESDIKLYYDNNKGKYSLASSVEVKQYSSKNKIALSQIKNNPLLMLNDISTNLLTLDMTKLNPELKFILNDTKINNFTPIFTSNKQYVSLLILKKGDEVTIPLSEIKNKIFTEIMKEREKNYLKNYFEKQKLTADIKILR